MSVQLRRRSYVPTLLCPTFLFVLGTQSFPIVAPWGEGEEEEEEGEGGLGVQSSLDL